MPAPSKMFGRQPVPSANQDSVNNNEFQSGSDGDVIQRNIIEPAPSSTRTYDEIFVSKPVGEVKTMLWEIKDFNKMLTTRVMRAMNFEFEMGRLGSMERHLPRRSRWRVMFDMEEIGSLCIPAIRVLQLYPENKIIFYKMEATVLERRNGTGAASEVETDVQTQNCGFMEGRNETSSNENLFKLQSNTSCDGENFTDQLCNYIFEGSLFLKIKMEILEDAST